MIADPALPFSVIGRGFRDRPRDARHISARTFVIVALGWPVLFLLTLFVTPRSVPSLLGDITLYVRMLFVVPLLLLAEPYVDGRLRIAVMRFGKQDIIDAAIWPRFTRLVDWARKWSGHPVVETAIFLGTFGIGWLVPPREPLLDWRRLPSGHLSPAGDWLLLYAVPLVRFLFARWLWRYLVWSAFLVRTSRLQLKLRATHPDLVGGLRFLPTCQSSFAVIVLAVSSLLVSGVHLQTGADPLRNFMTFAKPCLVLGVIAFVVLTAPLVFFTPVLLRTARDGDAELAALASRETAFFERRWFVPEEDPEVIHAPDFTTLTDLSSAVTSARDMVWLPFTKRSVLAVFGAALAPVIPPMLVNPALLEVLGKGLKLVM